ncbi:MAG: signal peptide peptidase SppA [SAR324 cluster bacterium]|nr:signal peptide peptidase SppA [SAR324 cluster bacterium]
MIRRSLLTQLAGSLLACFLLSGCYFNVEVPTPGEEPLVEYVLGGSGNSKVLILELNGVFSPDLPSRLSSGSGVSVAEIRAQLAKAQKDPLVRALVLHINSPGGEVTTADVAYNTLKNFRNTTGRPIVASIGSLGASGGYYAALAADRIYANPTAVVGSIGVVMMRFNARGLLEKVGVSAEVLASNPLKGELSSPLAESTASGTEVLQAILDDHYSRFVGIVRDRRRLSQDRALEIADGRVLSAPDAKEHDLIDEVGYLEDALAEATARAGLQRATYVTYQRKGRFSNPLLAQAGVSTQVNLLHVDARGWGQWLTPGFHYLWVP